VNEHLLWLSVKRHLGNQRQGTAAVKNKALVSAAARKPFKQKGTGRARQGSNTSPLMPGGGRAFGPRPRDYRTDLPRQQRRAALVSALSMRRARTRYRSSTACRSRRPRRRRVGVLESLGLSPSAPC